MMNAIQPFHFDIPKQRDSLNLQKRCLEKEKNYSLKWWFDDDLPYVESKQIMLNKSKIQKHHSAEKHILEAKINSFFCHQCNF